jgi:hypothetical protein
LKNQNARGGWFGLSKDELGASHSVVEVMGDEKLRLIARELVDIVRKNTSIDWTLKQSVQANLRHLVKRIFNKYGFPDLQARRGYGAGAGAPPGQHLTRHGSRARPLTHLLS